MNKPFKTIGFLRVSKVPRHLARLTSILCKYHNIELIYFTPSDISTDEGTVDGKVLRKNNWEDITAQVPRFIDLRSPILNRKQYKKQLDFLRKEAVLSVDKRHPVPKDKLNFYFGDELELSKHLIPSKRIKNTVDFFNFLEKHNEIVLKPIRSNQGRRVSIIKQRRAKFFINQYQIISGDKTEIISQSALKNWVHAHVKKSSMMVQKYINSRTPDGHPFDCRIHVEKNGEGKWSNPHNFIRIGIGQKVVSNVNQGGGISDVDNFLKTYYKDNYKSIRRNIKRIARILPYKIEEKLGKKYMTFGFDFGIDKQGNLFLFEVNDNPLIAPMRSKVAMLRVDYYNYMLKKLKES